jgi:uncharacterized membrane protein
VRRPHAGGRRDQLVDDRRDGRRVGLIYYARGDVSPPLAAAAVLGVLVGSRVGLWIGERAKAKWLKLLMAVVLAAVDYVSAQGMVINQTFDVVAFERLIAKLMQAGGRICAVCLVSGLALWMIGGSALGWRLLQAGLLALMAMPALRICLTIVESFRMKDRLFLAATVTVALILGATLLYAFAVGR